MKNTLLTLLLCLATCGLQAQKPEKIYPNAREQKSISYLKEQRDAWKKEIDKDPKNVNAWYNYYYANRNLGFNDTTDNRPVKERQATIDKVIDDMGKNIPDSYEYNLCKWMNGGWDMKLLPYLEKAEKLGPDRPEHIDYSCVLGEMERNIEKRNLYAKKKFDAGQISTGMLYYNYNVLMGLAPNAILITGGDNDTYPVWYLQSQGIRTDVKIVHLYLMNLKEYSGKLFKELGIEPWKPYNGKNPDSLNAYRHKYKDGVIAHIAANKKNLPVYLGLTAASVQNCSGPVEDQLYLTGLAYLYSKEKVDNIALLKRNFEHLYALDYIEKAFYTDISPEIVSSANGNYIVPMFRLYEHYKTAGDKQKEDWIKNKILSISKGRPDEDDIKKLLASR